MEGIQIRSLRVTAGMDVSDYTRAMHEKVAADRAMVESSKAVGAELARTDAAAGRSTGALVALSRQFIDGYGTAAKYEKAIRDIGRALDMGKFGQGPEGIDRASKLIEGASRKYGLLSDATALAGQGFVSLRDPIEQANKRISENTANLDRMAKAQTVAKATGHSLETVARSNSGALQQLSFQLNDVATMALSGSGAFQIFATQGGQILQVMQTAEGGARGLAREIAALFTPFRVGAVAIVAAAGAAAWAVSSFGEEQRDLQRQLVGTGREAGVTAARINEMAASLAKAQGTSTSQARTTLGALANSGRIDPAYLERIAGMSRDLAATLGVELSAATELLGNAFGDPIKGAEALNSKLGGLTNTTRNQIATLVASGRETEAYDLILRAFAPRIGAASELTGGWALAWEKVAYWATRARDATAQALQRPADPTLLDREEARLAGLGAQARGQVRDNATGRTLGNRSTFGQTQEDLQTQLGSQQRLTAEYNLQLIAVNALRIGVEGVRAANESLARVVYDAGRSRRAIETGASTATQMGLPDRLQTEGVRRLADQYRALHRAKDEAYQNQGREGGFETYRRAADDMRSAQRALRETVTDSSGMFARDGQLLLDNNAILERRRSLIQLNADRVQVERQGLTAVTQAEQAAAAAARVRQQAREQGAAAGGQELVNAQATAAAETVRVGVNHQLSEAAKERIRSTQLQVDAIRAESAAMGGSVGAIERARLEQQLLADAKREYGRLGLSVPPAEIEAYRQLAAVMGEARQAQAELRAQRDISFERQVIGLSDGEAQIARNLRQIYGDEGWRSQMGGTLASQARFNDQLKITNDLAKGFASDFLGGLREGKGLFDSLTSAATRFTSKLADKGIENFTPVLLAGENPLAEGMCA